MRRDLVILFVLALATRAVAALVVDFPPYVDPAYYQLVGEQLAAGRGPADELGVLQRHRVRRG